MRLDGLLRVSQLFDTLPVLIVNTIEMQRPKFMIDKDDVMENDDYDE